MEKDFTTEEKIKEAARKIFQQKGYAGTRTRDIAEEAGINLALLNYYYRSKEKLFELVMEESLKEVFSVVLLILNDSKLDFSEKINVIVNKYTDILLENPNLPIFILGEIQANPEKFMSRLGINQKSLRFTYFYRQLVVHQKRVGLIDMDPLHFLINLLSMTVFPYIAKPMLKGITGMDPEAFVRFAEERRVLIPLWIKAMLKIKN